MGFRDFFFAVLLAAVLFWDGAPAKGGVCDLSLEDMGRSEKEASVLAGYTRKQRVAIRDYARASRELNIVMKQFNDHKTKGERAPTVAERNRVSRELDRATKAFLDELGVPHHAVNTKLGMRFVIRPHQETALGRMTAGLDRVHGTKVVLPSGAERMAKGFGAMWDVRENTVWLSLGALVDRAGRYHRRATSVLTPTSLELHEIRHLHVSRETEAGADIVPQGYLAPRNGGNKDLWIYWDGLHLDEMSTYPMELFHNFGELRRLKSELEKPGLLQTGEGMKALHGALRGSNRRLLLIEDDIPKMFRTIAETLEEERDLYSDTSWLADSRRELRDGEVGFIAPDEGRQISFAYDGDVKEGVPRGEVILELPKAAHSHYAPKSEADERVKAIVRGKMRAGEQREAAEAYVKEVVLPKLGSQIEIATKLAENFTTAGTSLNEMYRLFKTKHNADGGLPKTEAAEAQRAALRLIAAIEALGRAAPIRRP